jgi:hypothetical protein
MALAACEPVSTTEQTTAATTTGTTTATITTQSDTAKVQAVLDALTLGDVSAVTGDLTLPSPTTNGVSVSWSSNNEDIINTFGEVTIPSYDEGDATVILTATATLNAVTLTKTFTVTVVAQTVEDYLTAAANSIIITGSDSITANFDLPSNVRGASVTWTSNNTTAASIAAAVDEDGYWLVTITRQKAEEGGVNVTVTLTATLTIAETSVQVTKTIYVIAEPPATVYTSFATLHETCSLNDYVDVTGIVYAKFSGGYFLLDTYGDYLAVYTSATYYNAVALGDQVRIKGLYKNYYTLFQISSLTYQEVLSSGNAYTITPVVLEDATDLLDIPASDDRIIHGTTYTITVTIDVTSSGYVDIYVGSTRVGTVYSYSLTDSINALKAQDGKIVTIDVIYYTLHPTNGVMVLFQGSAEDIEVAVLEGQEALDADTAAISVTSPVVGGQSVTLASTGTYGSAISWAVTSGGAYASIASGKVTFADVTETQTVVLTATVTLEGVATPNTKEITITVNPITTSTIAEVRAMTVSAQIVQVEGIVFFFTNNSYYIADATGMLNIYTAPISGMALGDRVVIVGTLAAYNSQIQLTSAIVKQTVSTGNDYTQAVTVYEAGVSELVSGHTYTVTGTVAILGSNNNVYIYNGETLLMAIYYRSTYNDSYNALKAQVGKQITFNAVYMYTGNDSNYAGANTIFFVYQEGAAGLTLPELSDAEKVASDKASLTISLEALSGGTATLPALGGYESAITWEVVSGGAVIADGVVTYPEVSENTDVVLRATITLNASSDTKEFTVVVAPIVPLSVSEVYDAIIALGTASQSINGTVEIFEGTILGFKWKSGFSVYEGIYVTDGAHVVYVYTSSTATDAFAIGDVILVKGLICTYYYLPEVSTVTVLQKVEDGTPAAYDAIEMTIADIYGYTNMNTPYYSAKITVKGTLVVGTGDSSTWLIDGEGHKLIFSRVVADLATLAELNGKEVVFTGFLNDYYNSYSSWRITGAGSTFELTDAQKAADDVADTEVKVSVVAEEAVTLPTVAANGSTIAWAIKSGAENITSLVDNVVTFANVTVTSESVLTATYTYTPAVGDPIVTEADYTFSISTLEVKLAADKEALTVAATANEFDVITLPTAGSNGSAITWVLTETPDAVLATNALTLNYKGEGYTVTVTATLTLSTFTDTKEFTITVSPVTVLTIGETIDAIQALGTATASIDGSAQYMMGTIVGFKWKSGYTQYQGIYLSDGTDVVFVYATVETSTYAVGDVILIRGTICTYYYLPEVKNLTVQMKLTDETPASYAALNLTIAEIYGYTNITTPYYSQQIVVTGILTVGSGDSSTYLMVDGQKLTFSYVVSSLSSIAKYNGLEVTMTCFLNDYHSTYGWRITGADTLFEVTDEVAVAADVAKITSPIELSSDYVLPTPDFATYDISAISTEVQPYLTESATGLTLDPQPLTDVLGTFTVTVSKGSVSQDVVVNVTIKAMTDEAKLAADIASLPSTLSLSSNYTLPSLTYGAYSADPIISSALTDNIVWTTVLEVTPLDYYAASVTGTVTLTVTVGSLTDTKEIAVTLPETPIGSYDFETMMSGFSTSYLTLTDVNMVNLLTWDITALISTHRVSQTTPTGKTSKAIVISPRIADPLTTDYDGTAWAEFDFGTDALRTLEFDVYYWSSTAEQYFTKAEVQVYTDGAWVTVYDLKALLAGSVETFHVTLTDLSGSVYRIYTEGGRNGGNDARLCVDNLKAYAHIRPLVLETFAYADETEFETYWTLRTNGVNSTTPDTDRLVLDPVNDSMILTEPETANGGWDLARRYATLASLGATDDYTYLCFYVTNNTNTTTLASVWLYWTGSQNAFSITLPATGTSGWVCVRIANSGHTATEIIDFAIGFNNWASDPVTGNLVVSEICLTDHVLS